MRAAIVAEALEEGAVVSAIVRRHGVAPSQVFAWRKARSNLDSDPYSVIFESGSVDPWACAEPLLPIEFETCGAKLRIPANASRDAILAVMEGLAAFKRRR